MAILDCTMSSKALYSNTKIKIIMPTTKLEGNEKYKVLYLLHGYTGDETDWMRFTNIELYSKQYNLAVIMPSVRNSFYQDMAYGANYYTFISKELPEQMEQMFPIRSDREGKFIAGMSMGGYGSLFVSLQNPQNYLKVASLSGAIDVQSMKNFWSDEIKTTDMEPDIYYKLFGNSEVVGSDSDLEVLVQRNLIELPDLYIACGTEDFFFPLNQKFHKFLLNNNVEHYYEETENYGHTWDYWDLKIKEILNWMFK